MLKSLFAIGCMAALAGCAAPPASKVDASAPTLEGQRQLALVGSFLTGAWRSIPPPNGVGDPTPTRLMHARVWPDIAGEYWIYAEYLPVDGDTPYRQRLYRLREDGGHIIARTYALPGNPADFRGEWRKERPFARVDPKSLRERENCRIQFDILFESSFMARPVGDKCASDRPGVATETTGFDVTSSELSAWTQGFDAAGKRVMGEAGPLELRKMSRSVR